MIGRKKEIEQLKKLYSSSKAELVAVYGRRRVGKTFLINETFENNFFFKHSGLSLDDSNDNKKTEIQLKSFSKSLSLYGMDTDKEIKDWFEAFFYLTKFIMQSTDKSKKVIFIDELPWLDTKGSNFISAFEGFWNLLYGLVNVQCEKDDVEDDSGSASRGNWWQGMSYTCSIANKFVV